MGAQSHWPKVLLAAADIALRFSNPKLHRLT